MINPKILSFFKAVTVALFVTFLVLLFTDADAVHIVQVETDGPDLYYPENPNIKAEWVVDGWVQRQDVKAPNNNGACERGFYRTAHACKSNAWYWATIPIYWMEKGHGKYWCINEHERFNKMAVEQASWANGCFMHNSVFIEYGQADKVPSYGGCNVLFHELQGHGAYITHSEMQERWPNNLCTHLRGEPWE